MTNFQTTELAKIVDQLVGDMHARRDRKQMIREELLAHVNEVFSEELACCGDEQVALSKTRRRFGALKELQFDLQHSVPFYERWLSSFERESSMSRKLWAVAIAAIAIGPGLIMPAVALYRDRGILDLLPLLIGIAITLAGVGLAGYGVKQRFAHSQ